MNCSHSRKVTIGISYEKGRNRGTIAGFQRKHWSMLLWSSVGGGDHGCVKYGNFECDLVKHDI